MQKYKEINGNDYVKNSRTTINETMQSIQSMNSGTAFPTNNLFEGMKCYRTDLKKTYTLTDVENNTWVEDAHATLSDEATHAASATKLDTARSLNLGGAVTADAATFDGTANATINVKTLDATKLKGTASVSTTGNAATASKLSTARKINITGNATGAATFDGTSDVSINVSVSQAAHADKATADKYGADIADNYIKHYINVSTKDLNDIRTGGLYAQSLSANATTARHYPENEACSILVIQNGANGVDGCTQICTTFASHNSYKREYDVVSKTWSAWRRYAFEDSTVSSAQKLSTARKINITGNAVGSATFDGSGDVSISTTVNDSKHAANADTAANANKLASESGSNYLFINTEEDNWSVIGPNPGDWLKSIRTDVSAPPYSIGNYSTAIAFGGRDTKGIITHAYNSPDVKFAGGSGSTAGWKFTIHGGYNNETYDLNNFPTKTGGGASGTWGINISGNAKTATTANTATNATHASSADSATNADKVDGYHENSFLRYRGAAAATGEDTLWSQIGIKDYNGKLPKGVSGTYNYGSVVSLPGVSTRLDIWYNHQCSTNKDGLWYRSGWGTDQKAWARLLDSNNYTNFVPTKTGAGASGTWGISISGNANTASTASSVAWSGVTGKPGTYPPSAHNHDSAYPSVTGTRASGTWGINISGNAASATNADKVDGYHASDLLSKAQGILPKTAAKVGQFRELVVNDSHQIKLPDGGTWAYFAFCYTSWSGDNSDHEHRIRMSSGIAAGGTVIHTDSYINSGSLRRMTGTSADNSSTNGGAAVGGFCWRIA